MRTFVATSCLAIALILATSMIRGTGDGVAPLHAAISTLDLTLASGRLVAPDYADAH